MKHTVSCLVKNQRGVLAQVSEAFAAKGINIESLAVAETENTNISRASIVVSGDDATVRDAERECESLDVVVRLEDFSSEAFYARDFMLVKVRVRPDTIPSIMQAAELSQARDRHGRADGYGGTVENIALWTDFRLVRPFGIVSLARSGLIAVSVSDEAIQEESL